MSLLSGQLHPPIPHLSQFSNLRSPSLWQEAVIARRPVKCFGQRLLQYDSYLTDKETESLSSMAQLMSGSAGTEPLHFCTSPLSELTSSSDGQEANPVLKTGTDLLIAGPALPASVPTLDPKVPDSYSLCFY